MAGSERTLSPLGEWRLRTGWTRKQLAERLGLSEVWVSKILNQREIPSLEVRIRIELATGGQVPAISWDGLKAVPLEKGDEAGA